MDRPIIFSAPMIRALLNGSKTQTRRLAWRSGDDGSIGLQKPTPWQTVMPGDKLWVREAARLRSVGPLTRQISIIYRADEDDLDGDVTELIRPPDAPQPYSAVSWSPAIHMPRWTSRLTLTVTAIRVERLQAISSDDARAEGCSRAYPWIIRPIGWFSDLWCQLHGDDAWDANPEIIVISFRVRRQNIDQRRGRPA